MVMRLAVVGLGLIGGSLGLGLRRRGFRVLGIARKRETCDQAIAQGVVDQASQDPRLLGEAEVVFICTPIAAIIPTAQSILPFLQPNTVLTDVGSVKASVVSSIQPLWPHFIGGHPMAGKAESSLDAAEASLFQDAPYVLTPTPATSEQAISIVTELVQFLGAKLYVCDPLAHDRAVALISHLPVIISASLISTCSQTPESEIRQLSQNLASSGFRDTSRVGGGNPELGVMMAQYNQAALLEGLYRYQSQLQEVIGLIEDQDWAKLEQFFENSQGDRSRFVS